MQTQILKALSVKDLTTHYVDDEHYTREIDVVISIGGFFGFYVIGVDRVLKRLEEVGYLKIQRYAGSSVGAICSIMMACNVPSTEIIKIYNNLCNQRRYFVYLKNEILQIIPPDAYRICTDKVFIIASRITPFGLCREVFSRFESNQDLVDAALASSCMPFFVSPYPFYRYKGGYYLDGCFSSHLPIFRDGSPDQLLIKLYRIRYYRYFSFNPIDPSIEGLIVKGCIEADKFFRNVPHHNVEALEWYNVQYSKKRIRKALTIGTLMLVAGLSTSLWMRYRFRRRSSRG